LLHSHEERERREYIRVGTVAAAIYNVNRDPKRRAQLFTYRDIFPHAEVEPREATDAEIDMFFTGVIAEQQKTAGKNGAAAPARRKVNAASMVEG
jgi:hypothetical protein